MQLKLKFLKEKQMSRSRSRLAADWFAKLRMNATTQEVEHIEVVEASETATAIDLTPKADVTYVDTEITAVEATVTSLSTSKADVTAMNTALATKADTTYVDGVTSSIQTQLNAKEPADATILKDADIGSTVLAPNGDGSQLTGIDALPDQTGHSGKYLNTDGTGASWQSISSDPTMGGDLSGTASNAQIVANAVGSAEIANSAVTDSKISGMSSSKLSGALPAIDGSALTNLPASGFTSSTFLDQGTLFSRASANTLHIPDLGGVVNGTLVEVTETTKALNTAGNWDASTYATAANRAGKDFYVYLLEAGGVILSNNSTVPTGYTSSNSRKIAGFHCLCTAVGTISGHSLSG